MTDETPFRSFSQQQQRKDLSHLDSEENTHFVVTHQERNVVSLVNFVKLSVPHKLSRSNLKPGKMELGGLPGMIST